MKSSILVFLSFVLLFPISADAQDTLAVPAQFWVGLSYGAVGGANYSGDMAAFSLSLVRDYEIYGVRVLTARKPSVPVAADVFNSSSQAVSGVLETSVLYGIAFKKKLFLVSASVGIGYVWADTYSSSFPTFRGWAFPFDIQMGFTPTPVLGVSLHVFGDVNSRASFDGSMVCIRIGKLW